MAPQSLGAKTPSRPFSGQERAVVLPAPIKVNGPPIMIGPKIGSAATPGGFHTVRAARRSMGRPIWDAAIGIDRLVRQAIRRLSTAIAKSWERDLEERRLQRLSDHMLQDIGARHHDIDYRIK